MARHPFLYNKILNEKWVPLHWRSFSLSRWRWEGAYESSFWAALGSHFPCLEVTMLCWNMVYILASPRKSCQGTTDAPVSPASDRAPRKSLIRLLSWRCSKWVVVGNHLQLLCKMFWNSHLKKQLKWRRQEGHQVLYNTLPGMNNFLQQSSYVF